jgi:peptide/nickel transport system substrate-binding protein
MTEAEKVPRRKFLKYGAGVVAVAVVAAAGYEVYETSQAPQTTMTTAPATSTATSSSAPTTAATSAMEQTLVVALDNEVLNIDPADASSYSWASNYATSALYDQLTEYEKVEMASQPGFTEYVPFNDTPMLATSWDWAPDGKSVTYHLRQKVKFPDGNEMTAKDVKYSLERFPKTSTISFLAGLIFFDHCEVIDDYTVKIVMTQPSPMAKKTLALRELGSVFDSTLALAHTSTDDPVAEKWLAKNPAAHGPFLLDHWTPGVEFVMKANPNYWRGKPALDKVVFSYTPAVSDRAMMVQQGAADVATSLPGQQLHSLEGNPNVKILTHVSPTWVYGNINHSIEPWGDKGFRQALSYAIPYDTILNQVLYGYATQQTSPITQGVETHTDEFWQYKYDLDTARKLLDKTSYAGGVTVDGVYDQANDQDRDIMTWIQSSFAKINVTMNLKPMPSAALSDMRVAGKAPLHLWTSNPFVKDPFFQFVNWYHSHKVGNWPLCIFPNDPAVDKMIDDNMNEMDANKRNQASKELQKMILDDATLFFLYQPKFVLVARKNINGLGYWCDESWGRSLQYVTKG